MSRKRLAVKPVPFGDPCPRTPTKPRFRWRGDAIHYMRRVQTFRNDPALRPLEPYRCSACGYYHLATKHGKKGEQS